MPNSHKLRWRLLSFLMRTLGRASDGIALGYRYGFDSGEMLDYVYESQARGKFLYGPLVDRVYLNSVGWRAIRARKVLLKEVIRREITSNRAQKRETVLLNVASGPGRYLQELDQALGQPTDLTIICRDLDEAGLEQGRREAARKDITNIRYEVGDACDAASLAQVTPRPNLVVASGLYELLDVEPIKSSMSSIYNFLENDGRLIFTTQVTHPQLELIANVLPNRFGQPWVMECRSLEEVKGYAREAGFRDLTSQMEPNGLFAVIVGRK